MILTSEARHVDGAPTITALAAHREGSSIFVEAIYVQATLPAGPLPCVFDDGTTPTPVVIDWPGVPADARMILPGPGRTTIGFNILKEETHGEENQEGH